MGITKRQLAKKADNIGSSELYRMLFEPYGLWLEKTGKSAPPDLSDNKAVQAGIILEDALIRYAELSLGKIIRNQERRVEGTPILAHIDGIVEKTGEPVECKSSNLIYRGNDDWGDENTDNVPHRVIVQSQGHLMALKNKPAVCHVPALIGGKGLLMYVVPRNEAIISVIGDAAIKFWDLVQRDIPPDDKNVNIEVLRRVKRIPNKIVKVELDEVSDILAMSQQLEKLEQQKKKVKAQLLQLMQDGEVLDVVGHDKVYRKKTFHKNGYTVEPYDYDDYRWVNRDKFELEYNKPLEIEEKANG